MDHSIGREHAWGLRGKRVYGEKSGKMRERVSLIAAFQGKELKAPLSFRGYCNTEFFNTWVERCLLPELSPGKVVVLDNASFHKSAKTRQLIEPQECRVRYLPTYSPDLNPIEKQWAILKARIRKHRKLNQPLHEAIKDVFQMY